MLILILNIIVKYMYKHRVLRRKFAHRKGFNIKAIESNTLKISIIFWWQIMGFHPLLSPANGNLETHAIVASGYLWDAEMLP